MSGMKPDGGLMRDLIVGAGAVVSLLGQGVALAQAYPAKPIRWIVAFAPGGGADVTSRTLAPKLSDLWGQQVVVENRPGAGGMIGTEIAARTAPDGYTIMLGPMGPMATNVSLYSKLPYDAARDFVAITQVADTLSVLVVHPSLPVHSVKELIALARARPGLLNFSSSGAGVADHLGGELFKSLLGLQITHVPYKGGGPSMIDLVAGHVQLSFASLSSSSGQIQAGRLRALAIAGKRRFELMPELPTVAEAGVPGFELNNWHGVYVPAGASPEIVSKIYADVVKVLQMADVKTRLLGVGIMAVWSEPGQFAAFQLAETQKWAKVIKAANIRVE